MPHWKQHVDDSELILGKGWNVVHHWLDEFAKIYFPHMIHRVHRHHKEGIEEVRQKWGDEAAKSAMIHILTDEGKIMTRTEIHNRYGLKDDLEDFPSEDALNKQYGAE